MPLWRLLQPARHRRSPATTRTGSGTERGDLRQACRSRGSVATRPRAPLCLATSQGRRRSPVALMTSVVVTGIQRDSVDARSLDRNDPRGRIGAVEQDLGRQRLRDHLLGGMSAEWRQPSFEYTPRGFSTMARFARLATGVLDTVYPPRCAACRRRGCWVCDDCLATSARFSPPMCDRCGIPFGLATCRCSELAPELSMHRSVGAYGGWLRSAIIALQIRRRTCS